MPMHLTEVLFRASPDNEQVRRILFLGLLWLQAGHGGRRAPKTDAGVATYRGKDDASGETFTPILFNNHA